MATHIRNGVGYVPAKIDLFTNEEFAKIVSESFSMIEVAKKLGYTSHSGSNGHRIRKRIDELQLSTSHFSLMHRRAIARTPENLFIENSTAAQKTLREHYIKGKYTPYVCAICGQEPFWNGKPMILILDHINGKNHDDRLENLRWVCPNCNYQLDTTNSRNWVKQRLKS